jgi:hypothetical protein
MSRLGSDRSNRALAATRRGRSTWSLPRHLFGFERPETDGERIAFRLLEAFVAFEVVSLAWSWGHYALRIGDVVLPLGVARWLDISFMHGNALPLVNAALITGLVVLGFVRFGRWSYAGALVLLLFQYAARYSLGEIPHSANVTGIALLALALAPPLFDSETERRRFAIGFMIFFVGLGYTLAAWSKLIATGPMWVDGRHLWIWVYEKGIDAAAKTGVFAFNPVQQLVLSDYWIATAFLSIGLLTEFFAFLMWWRPFRLAVGLAVLGLHVGIKLAMGILFGAAMVIVAFLCLPWDRLIDAGLRRFGPKAGPPELPAPLRRVLLGA